MPEYFCRDTPPSLTHLSLSSDQHHSSQPHVTRDIGTSGHVIRHHGYSGRPSADSGRCRFSLQLTDQALGTIEPANKIKTLNFKDYN